MNTFRRDPAQLIKRRAKGIWDERNKKRAQVVRKRLTDFWRESEIVGVQILTRTKAKTKANQ